MNLRRYALFFIVAILTFAIGVGAAALVAGANPFSRARKHGGCRRLSSLPGPRRSLAVYTVYRPDGTVVRAYDVDKAYGLERLGRTSDEAAPPPPPPVIVTEAPRPPR